jgi:hypothetical protein
MFDALKKTIARSQRLRLANATVQPAGPSDPNIWHAIHFHAVLLSTKLSVETSHRARLDFAGVEPLVKFAEF